MESELGLDWKGGTWYLDLDTQTWSEPEQGLEDPWNREFERVAVYMLQELTAGEMFPRTCRRLCSVRKGKITPNLVCRLLRVT